MAFLGRPKPVEVLHRDRWHIGALLGWRHDADGSCWLRVSALVDGYKRTAWVGIDTVRLPVPPPRAADHTRLLRHGDRPARPLPPLASLRPDSDRPGLGARLEPAGR